MLIKQQFQIVLLKWRSDQQLKRLRRKIEKNNQRQYQKIRHEVQKYAAELELQRKKDFPLAYAARAGRVQAVVIDKRRYRFGEYPIEVARQQALAHFARAKARAMQKLIAIMQTGIYYSLRELAAMIGVKSPNTVRAYKQEVYNLGLVAAT